MSEDGKKAIRKTDKTLKDGRTDPFGSYTGVPTDGSGNPTCEKPVQDADDL